MTLRVFEAFAGVGSQRMALRNLGIDHEIVAIAEIDKFAIKSYEAIHGETNNLGDISQIETADIPDHDLFTYSFPCFTGDTLVLTDDGYKRIDEINIGDMVLTHTGQYKRVVSLFNQGKKEIVKYVGSTGEIITTKNHKFRVKSKLTSQRGLELGEAAWKPIGELTGSDYVGLAINQESRLPVYTEKPVVDNFNNPSFWWMVGRYIADGCINYIDRNGKLTNNGLFISVGYNNDLGNVRKHLSNITGLGKFSENNVKDTVQFITYNKDLINYLKQFGRYAHNKKLTGDIINLPTNLAKSFLEGYESGDGWYNSKSGEMSITSTSKELLLGIGQLVIKIKNVPYRLYFNEVPKKKTIEGREVNQRDFWILRYIENPRKKTYIHDGLNIWVKFKGIVEVGEDFVYDIEVEDDHSFTASNLVVKNCQDISVAGRGLGLDEGSDTRSGLLWECQKVIAGKKPKYLLLENVKNLVGKKHKHNFYRWLEWLEEQGYTNYWQVLNAKDYGIPQNRERVFVVSILGEHEPYEFPKPIPLELRLKDVLESEVDEKFYLSQKIQDRLTLNLNFKNEIKTIGSTKGKENTRAGQRDVVYSDEGIMGATDYKQPKQIVDNKIKQIGQYDTANRKNKSAYRVYDSQGISPTLSTMQGGGRQPSVVVAKEEYGRMGRQAVETLNDNDVKHSDTINPFGKRVSSKNGISPTLTTRPEGFKTAVLAVVDSIELPAIGASRGRNPENPSDSTAGSPTEQRLEINKQGTSNTITTVQKDNYVVEPKERTDYVGENETYTIEVLRALQKEIGKEAYAEWEDRGLRVLREKEILRQDVYGERLDAEENRETQERKVKSTECENESGVFYGDQGVSEVFVDEKSRRSPHRSESYEQFARQLGSFMQELSYEESSQEEVLSDLWRTAERVGSVQQALHQIQKIWRPELYKIPSFRIRKLSPLECWRLMGFSDDDFHKAEEVNSNTQLYKQAGNSIVVDVLEAIFKQLLED